MSDDIEFLKSKYYNAQGDERAKFRKLTGCKEFKEFMSAKELRERLEKKLESGGPKNDR